MTKSNFSVEKLQRKSVRTVWGMARRRELKGIPEYYTLGSLLEYCQHYNLATVKQILKAIR